MPLVALSNLQQFAAVNLASDGGYHRGPKIIPNAAMVRLNWTLPDGKVGHNILYATYTGAPALSVALADTVFSAMKAQFTSSGVAPNILPACLFAGVTLLDVRSTTGTELTSTGAAAPGTATGGGMPDESAIVITLRTAVRGRSGRGRIYIPGWAAVAMAAGGIVSPGVVAALQGWATNGLFAAINTNVGAPVLGLPLRDEYTSPKGTFHPQRPATTVPIIQYLVRNNTWDTQRRRGLK